jgi:hypothetical protein
VTGNIGLHHIHHIRPRIPNYNLQQCYDDLPAMRAVTPLTIRGSLKSLRMNLWDEDAQKLVSFRSVRKRVRSYPGSGSLPRRADLTAPETPRLRRRDDVPSGLDPVGRAAARTSKPWSKNNLSGEISGRHKEP